MRAVLLAVVMGAVGCYPALPGSWDDYYVPEDVQILAVSLETSYAGSYWDDPSFSTSRLWWGWLAESGPGWVGLDILAPGGMGCAPERDDFDTVLAAFEDPGAALSTVSGAQELDLPFWSEAQIFYAEQERLASGRYDLDSMDTDGAGSLEVQGMLRHPDPPQLEGPPMDGDSVAFISLDELVFTWDPEDEAGDYVWIKLMPAVVEEGSYVAFESIVCIAPYADGELVIEEDVLSDPQGTEGIYVYRGLANETAVRVGHRDVSAAGFSLSQQLGFVAVQ